MVGVFDCTVPLRPEEYAGVGIGGEVGVVFKNTEISIQNYFAIMKVGTVINDVKLQIEDNTSQYGQN